MTIGEWVLRTACAQNRAWQTAGLSPIRVAVNLSARQLREPHLLEMIARVLQETQLDPRHLELEITETTVMKNVDRKEQSLLTLDCEVIQGYLFRRPLPTQAAINLLMTGLA